MLVNLNPLDTGEDTTRTPSTYNDIVLGEYTPTGGDAPTLIVTYLSGNQFTDNAVIFDTASNLAAQALASGSTGTSSVASIAQGVFYVLGTFVQVNPSTVILSKYSSSPSIRVGLTITEQITNYISDSSLLDPAVGASNYQAPGADRYLITLDLESRPITFGDDDGFIELVRVENGNIAKLVDGNQIKQICKNSLSTCSAPIKTCDIC